MTGIESQDRARPTVVLVDDAAEVRTLVRTRLELSGLLHVVAEGATGVDAIAAAREHRPDLLVLDVSMPVMDGLAALPRIREVSPATRVVMYSGFQEEGLAERARELGATAFLEKSTALESLAEELRSILAGGPRVESGAAAAEIADVDEADRQVLRQHLERFREVFDDAAIGMATVTLTGQVVRANAALATLFGRAAQELVGQSYAGLAGPHAERIAAALSDVLSGRSRVVQFEHDVRVDGASRRVVATVAPVLDTLERPLYLFFQVQDVSAQRGAEEQLRRSEVRFRLLVDNIEDYAIFMLSPQGVVESWNVGAQRIKGYTAEEIVGQHFRIFYPPEPRAAQHPEHELELALRDGHYEEEGWRIRKDGSRFWANVVITAVQDEAGRHIGFAKITRDISAQREQAEQLRQSEERFRLLVETVGDYAIFMLDPDGLVASWNRGAERNTGYLAEEIIGRHFRVFYPPQLQQAGHPEHELDVAVRDGRYEEEGWRVRKDGTRFWSSVVITAVRDEHGGLVGFAKVTRDISERRAMAEERERAAAALAEANAQLRQAADDQAHFLAVTAHELRTPVGVLAGTADLLAAHGAELDEADSRQLLAGMSSSAARLRRLLDDLLTASRLQASTLELADELIDPRRLLDEAAEAARRIDPDVLVEVVAEPGLWLRGDQDRLAQAVDNLIANALRHGVPPVRVSARAVGDTVEIEVCDAGAGVAEEVRGRLFERFATGRGGGGTGLGLFIVRQLARAHRGEATYRPAADGSGGSFVLTLPRAVLPDG